MTKQLTAAESSKLLKKTLRAAFKGTKFSVRMSRGTGYGSVYVSWTDGPSVEAVDKIANTFQGKTFDGMTDSTNYHRTLVEMDGETVEAHLGYVSTSRTISAEAALPHLERCAEAVKVLKETKSTSTLLPVSVDHDIMLGYEHDYSFRLWIGGSSQWCDCTPEGIAKSVAAATLDLAAQPMKAAPSATETRPAKSLNELIERFAQ